MRLLGHSTSRHHRQRGQALVEFSLIIPIFMTLVVAIMEFSFLLTVKIGVTDAAQNAVQLAAQMGNDADADFAILSRIENDVSAPMDKGRLLTVEIFRTDSYGTANLGTNKYTRGGSFANVANTLTVPYARNSTGYMPVDRCNVMSGSGCSHTGGVDYIGVKITYQYSWVTPLPNLVGLGSSPPTFVQSSVSRLEPIQ